VNIIDPKKCEKVFVWDENHNIKRERYPISYGLGGISVVSKDFEEPFLAGEEYDIVRYPHWEPIPKKKTRPMNPWEIKKFRADNAGMLCRFEDCGVTGLISDFVITEEDIDKIRITENTGKKPREEDWRPLPEVEE
jgi:hypothetical protein